MLNALVRNRWQPRRLLPARFEDVPRALLAPGYDLVLAIDVPQTASGSRRSHPR